MKTPEEIEKGLEYCYSAKPCVDCKYDQRDFPHCVRRLLKDAIDGYRQLESRLAQVERENKAMLHDMAKYTMCGACKRFADKEQCPQHDECVYGKIGHFEWRGVCAENTEEE